MLGTNHEFIKFKVDTGSKVNILLESLYNVLTVTHTLSKLNISYLLTVFNLFTPYTTLSFKATLRV